jgi:DNA-binding MarR family transcriptional regulator
LNLEYCKELIVLADLLSFSKAAERLYITQSTLSKHVAAAEREAGFRIFDRTTSHVALTEAGRIYIDYLRQVVDRYDLAIYYGKNQEKAERDLAAGSLPESERAVSAHTAVSGTPFADTPFADVVITSSCDQARRRFVAEEELIGFPPSAARDELDAYCEEEQEEPSCSDSPFHE